jgi:hypothetical protein
VRWGKIRPSPTAGSARGVRGVVLGLRGTGFGRSPGRWGSWQSRVTAAAAAGRGMPGSGEPPAGARELAARSTVVEGRLVLGRWLDRGSQWERSSAAAAMEPGGGARSGGRRSCTRGEGSLPL